MPVPAPVPLPSSAVPSAPATALPWMVRPYRPAHRLIPSAKARVTTGAAINATFITGVNRPDGLVFAAVPEPGSLALVGAAAGAIGWAARRRRTHGAA